MSIKENIQKLIDQNDICLFMKGTPEAPQCGFSMTVTNVLKHLNVKFKGVNVLEDQKLMKLLKTHILTSCIFPFLSDYNREGSDMSYP